MVVVLAVGIFLPDLLQSQSFDDFSSSQFQFGTYYGGSAQEFVEGMATDRDGNVYIVGHTASTDFPTSAGALQEIYGGGLEDAFVVKFAPDGTLLYATLLGGSMSERANAVAVDSIGQAYVVGVTESDDFPGLPAGTDIQSDAFVVKLSASGDQVLHVLTFGGAASDEATDIVVDVLGRAYVCGITSSSDFPASPNAVQDTLAGRGDGFAARLNATGDALEVATYYGGSLPDEFWGIDIDSVGNIYLTGNASSQDFPVVNAYQATSGGVQDVVLVKLSPGCTTTLFSTYLGGSSFERGSSIDLGPNGDILLTGGTQSTNFPAPPGEGYQVLGASDAFVARLSGDGQTLLYSYLLGGSGSDWGTGAEFDLAGRALVAGFTSSDDFPLQNAIYSDFAGSEDAFLTCLSADGDSLLFSTYLGGSNFDEGAALALTPDSRLLIAGQTMSTNFPTQNPWQALPNGAFDAFAASFGFGCPDPDGDDICSVDDNCPNDYNPLQEDYDGDGIGDACDPCSSLPPVLTLPDTLFHHTGQYCGFEPQVTDPDDTEHLITFLNFPDWCQADNDSMYGTTVDSNRTDTVVVEAQDACSSDIDTMLVVTYICADADMSNSVNISDAVRIINYIFTTPPPEIALYAADPDCDGSTNISDAVYIIMYIFADGDPPCFKCW